MTENTSIRYEKKFVVPFDAVYTLEPIINTHPALFSEIYEERKVNNIYLDTINLSSYQTHINGVSQREKIRIRWYGNNDTNIQSVLEIKARTGDVGFKKHYPLPSSSVEKLIDNDSLHKTLETASLSIIHGIDLKSLNPTMFISYRRSYWLSEDKHFRLTIDRDAYASKLDGYQTKNYLTNGQRNDDVILELKYDCKHHALAQTIGQHFPWRQTRNSKYVRGIEQVST